MTYRTLNPATEELVESFPEASDEHVERAIVASGAAFADWRKTPLDQRSRLMLEAAEQLDGRAAELAGIMALEMGKPLAEGQAEASKCAWGCRYFAGAAGDLLSPRSCSSDGSEAFVRYDPLGPILAIMPWNYPFWQFFRFAAPTLMAGNTVLLKHSPNTPRCALTIESLMRDAGFPDGTVQSLFLTDDQAARVIRDDRVRGATLTGSTRAGRQVAGHGGEALKPMVMELGGSDPFIVFDDADIEEAARAGVAARCQNSGQSCIAAKRFLIHRSRYEEFAEQFVLGMQARVIGDPREPEVDTGPLARVDLRDKLAAQVEESLSAGAEARCGGMAHDGRGFFYNPTVLVNVEPGSPAATEELFGPVAALFPFRTEEQAIQLADSTCYGLGASVWTVDPERAQRVAAELDTGNVFVNGPVKSDPRLPFGGVKASGFGRELSREGMLSFVNTKTVWVR